MLENLQTIPEYIYAVISTIYECTQYYYPEDDDPSSTVRLKKILPIINIMFMRFLFAPEIIDMKLYQKANTTSLQAMQCMSKAYSSITFGKMFSESSEYGLHLINDKI